MKFFAQKHTDTFRAKNVCCATVHLKKKLNRICMLVIETCWDLEVEENIANIARNNFNTRLKWKHMNLLVSYQKYLQGNLCLICNQTMKNERVHLRKIHRVLYLSHVNEYQLLYQSHIKENEFRLAKDLNCQFCQKLFKTHFRGSLNESNLI